MKITAEHCRILSDAIGSAVDTIPAPAKYIAAGLNHKRYRWDLLHAAKAALPDHFVVDTLYQYLNDTHIDTALRSIVPPFSQSLDAAKETI